MKKHSCGGNTIVSINEKKNFLFREGRYTIQIIEPYSNVETRLFQI